jgi:hypothetical protein
LEEHSLFQIVTNYLIGLDTGSLVLIVYGFNGREKACFNYTVRVASWRVFSDLHQRKIPSIIDIIIPYSSLTSGPRPQKFSQA